MRCLDSFYLGEPVDFHSYMNLADDSTQFLYPVSWGLCEGGNVITPDDEAVFYGCLDFCAKPIFSILLLWGHWNIEPSRLGLRIASADELITDKDTSYGRHVGNGAASNNGVTSGENTG